MSIVSALGSFGGLVTGNPLAGPVTSVVSSVAGSAANLALQGISSWVLNGTKGALEEVASAISSTTAPNLQSTWFSAAYWRVAALAAMLTIPFLCAAAVQAVSRADLGLLARSAFGYLPLSVLGVSLAAPLTMLLLAATDQMSSVVSASAAGGGARFLDSAAGMAGVLAVSPGGSPFFAVAVGLLAVLAALALAIELLIRAAAVYVVVLMLPLAFAALVWPARRVWAARLVELLVSLVLSKFVIVAVLSLAAAAFTGGIPGIGELLVAMSLILLSTFAPWALMRVLPFTELAAGAAGILRGELSHAEHRAAGAAGMSAAPSDLAMQLPGRLRAQALRAQAADDGVEPITSTASPSPDGGARVPRPGTGGSGTDTGQMAAEQLSADPLPSPQSHMAAEPSPGAAGGTAAGSEAGGQGTAAAPTENERAPFVLPEAWQRSEPVRLDEGLLRPPTHDEDSAEEISDEE